MALVGVLAGLEWLELRGAPHHGGRSHTHHGRGHQHWLRCHERLSIQAMTERSSIGGEGRGREMEEVEVAGHVPIMAYRDPQVDGDVHMYVCKQGPLLTESM